VRQEWLKEILVEGLLSKGISKTGEKVVISPQKLEALPGVTDADILFSLQQLPGGKAPMKQPADCMCAAERLTRT
jgi:hypothetical protein